ncbi:hypothetical protein CPB86DRAFT_793819 [Serendipita vermifera]|nr:hypothetical protein CPB86DRAFT_793819 [Serendipita vermifera]
MSSFQSSENLNSRAHVLCQLCLQAIKDPRIQWPTRRQQPVLHAGRPEANAFDSTPRMTITLSDRLVFRNTFRTIVKAYRIYLEFGLQCPPIIFYLPMALAGSRHLEQVLAAPLELQILARLQRQPYTDSLVNNYIQEAYINMKMLLTYAPVDCFEFEIDSPRRSTDTVSLSLGAIVHQFGTDHVVFSAHTLDGYCIMHRFPTDQIPPPEALRRWLIDLYSV